MLAVRGHLAPSSWQGPRGRDRGGSLPTSAGRPSQGWPRVPIRVHKEAEARGGSRPGGRAAGSAELEDARPGGGPALTPSILPSPLCPRMLRTEGPGIREQLRGGAGRGAGRVPGAPAAETVWRRPAEGPAAPRTWGQVWRPRDRPEEESRVRDPCAVRKTCAALHRGRTEGESRGRGCSRCQPPVACHGVCQSLAS